MNPRLSTTNDWDVVEQPMFVTFHLHGSLPANRVFAPERLTTAGRAFLALDRLLDRTASGSLLLSQPEIAEWLGPLKGFTAHEANRLLGRVGEPFWMDENYDHLVRFRMEFERICSYIERNPVKAGLVATPEEFRWSSAHIIRAA